MSIIYQPHIYRPHIYQPHIPSPAAPGPAAGVSELQARVHGESLLFHLLWMFVLYAEFQLRSPRRVSLTGAATGNDYSIAIDFLPEGPLPA